LLLFFKKEESFFCRSAAGYCRSAAGFFLERKKQRTFTYLGVLSMDGADLNVPAFAAIEHYTEVKGIVARL
jgi:hypothetical protein